MTSVILNKINVWLEEKVECTFWY